MPNTLPLSQLSESGVTPEKMVMQQIEQGQQAFRNKYSIIFKEINRRGPALGQQQYNNLMHQTTQKAKLEANEFRQRAQAAMQPYQQVATLESQGLISPEGANEAKWRMALPPETERVMFPKPEEETDPLDTLNKQDVVRKKIESRMMNFLITPPETERVRGSLKKALPAMAMGTPGMIYALKEMWGKKGERPQGVMMRDPLNDKFDEKGKLVPAWKEASEAEKQELHLLMAMDVQLREAQKAIMGNSNMAARMRGSEPQFGLGEKVRKEARMDSPERGQQAVYAQNPKTKARLVSNDGGKTWQPVK